MPGSWSPSGPLVKGRPLGLAEDEVGGPSGSAVEAAAGEGPTVEPLKTRLEARPGRLLRQLLVKGRPLGLAEDEVGGPSGSAVEATTAHHLEIKYIEKF